MGKLIQFHPRQETGHHAMSGKRASTDDGALQLSSEAVNDRVSLVRRETVEEIYSAVSGLARKRHVAIRRASVSKATDSELVHWISSSSHLAWKQHPSFYLAVVQEAKKRWKYLR